MRSAFTTGCQVDFVQLFAERFQRDLKRTE